MDYSSAPAVKSAMLAVAGAREHLVAGDAHKCVVAGLILSGARRLRVDPA